jgi:hypothetical protein
MTDRTYRILVTGSRDWTSPDFVYEAIKDVIELEMDDNPDTKFVVVHGNARGADTHASKAVNKLRKEDRLPVTVEKHDADWTQHGKRAGFVRNAQMVELGADTCLAFIRDASAGATMAADLAESAGILTMRYKQ